MIMHRKIGSATKADDKNMWKLSRPGRLDHVKISRFDHMKTHVKTQSI